MKKIVFLIIIVFVLVGFSESKTDDKIINVNSKIKTKKEYYVSVVPYVDHDDYHKVKNMSSNQVNVVLSTSEVKENSKEQVAIIEESAIKNLEMENENKAEEISIASKSEKNNQEDFSNEQIIDEEQMPLKEDEKEILLTENEEDIEVFLSDNSINLEQPVVDEQENKVNEVLPVKGYYSPSGKYLGDTKVKVIDVSYYQGDINWDTFAQESDCYGVILRLGYWDTLDKKFERNINEIKRLNIPYGIYLFSYSTTINGALTESSFTNQMIDKYNLNPTLGIYYDIESWSSSNGSSSNNISKEQYDKIISTYINAVSNHVGNKYKVRVYSGRWYAMNRLGQVSKSYVDWVAEYNSTCKYDGSYSMWQYTSKGSVPGVNGNVDISYLY